MPILKLAGAIALFVLGLIFQNSLRSTPGAIGEYAIFLAVYFISGWTVLTTAGRNILKGEIFDENFLMTVATLGAIALQELPEAAGVMLFFNIGEMFQEFSVSRSRRSIQSLLKVRPESAHLYMNGEVQTVDPDTVEVGATIVVKPGEKVPLDGEILGGTSQLDTSALTGESVPQGVTIGDRVLAGSINQSGLLEIRTTRLFGESSIAKILDLVENASSKKAKPEKFITRFARIYTPIVVGLSLLVALIPPLVIPGATSQEWVYRALVILVISCPCGLVISIPLAYFGGVGCAAKQGILVKGSMFLDTLRDINTVVFDKTGTLTKGVFEVNQIVTHNGYSSDELLETAAKVEAHSNHPIARAIREAYGGAIDFNEISNYEEISGHGIRANVLEKSVLAGNDRLLHRENIDHDRSVCQLDSAVAHLVVDRHYIGYISIEDDLKEDAESAIRQLRELGIDRAVMLTGDNDPIAAKMAAQLGLNDYRANLLPEDKVTALEEILRGDRKVAYIGDGINDAPVLARADIGIAMGGLGSDAAIETADAVIASDAPSKLPQAIRIARQTYRIVWQNIGFAMGIKALFILFGAIGIATMWGAVFADVGVALLAILNATRLLGYR
jgi:Cd2+/Zn2+-exporting ATPase